MDEDSEMPSDEYYDDYDDYDEEGGMESEEDANVGYIIQQSYDSRGQIPKSGKNKESQ